MLRLFAGMLPSPSPGIRLLRTFPLPAILVVILLFASSAGDGGVAVSSPASDCDHGVLLPSQNHRQTNLRTRQGGIQEKPRKMWRTFLHRGRNIRDRLLGFFPLDRNGEGEEEEEGDGGARGVEYCSSVGLLHHRDEGEHTGSRSSVLARGNPPNDDDQVELAGLADRRTQTRAISLAEETHSCGGRCVDVWMAATRTKSYHSVFFFFWNRRIISAFLFGQTRNQKVQTAHVNMESESQVLRYVSRVYIFRISVWFVRNSCIESAFGHPFRTSNLFYDFSEFFVFFFL